MKANEKALAKQILSEEEELAQKAALREQREQQLADSIAKLPKGFRFKEIRSVAPNHLPVILDFSEKIPVKKFKLSEFSNKIEYITLSVPDDSLYFSPYMGGTVSFIDKAIILNNNFGIHRFALDGKFIETIARSNVRNRTFSKQLLFGYYDKAGYKGVWGNHVSVAGNRVFYKVSDYPRQKVSLFQYEVKNDKQFRIPQIPENPTDDSFFKGMFITSGKEKIRSGTQGLSSTKILGVSSNFYAGVNSHLNASSEGVMLATFNLKGDTLCKFTQFDKLEHPITSSVVRSIQSIIHWEYKGIFSFKKSFNDTIFRLIPPNRLVPAYVFKLGKNKITDEEWYQTDRKLCEKILITSIVENEKYLFIEYYHYNETGKKDMHKAVFEKANSLLRQLPMFASVPHRKIGLSSHAYCSTIDFENDIDSGLPFWPEFVTPQGTLGMLIRPEELKNDVEKIEEDTGNEKAEKLKRFTKTLKKDINERVIVLVK